jgi:hypothetical protein
MASTSKRSLISGDKKNPLASKSDLHCINPWVEADFQALDMEHVYPACTTSKKGEAWENFKQSLTARQ